MDIDFRQVEDYLLGYPKSFVDYPFGQEPSVYKVRLIDNTTKMFALLIEKNGLLNISLKCDPQLALDLRQKYESVMAGYHLSKKHWNTIIMSGQLSWQEIKDLIRHSYDLVCKADETSY